MNETFRIVPGPLTGLWILVPACVILISVLIFLAFSMLAPRRVRFELDGDRLRFRGDLYGRPVAISELQLEQARIVDLREEKALRAQRRTAGTALPGYQAGSFRLQNGEKALLYLTRRDRALYIPTSRGYSLLLSPEEPERMLEALRMRAGR